MKRKEQSRILLLISPGQFEHCLPGFDFHVPTREIQSPLLLQSLASRMTENVIYSLYFSLDEIWFHCSFSFPWELNFPIKYLMSFRLHYRR